tara:strand:+ start:424 stop:924 length:501 start_codon:yes stop_codon:yes gene_type:complete
MTSILKVDTIQGANGSDIPYIKNHVLQVKQTVKTDIFNTADNTFVDITGLTVDITPQSTSSTIMVEVHIGNHNSSGATSIQYNLRRGSSNIGTSTGGSGTNCSFAATITGNRGEAISMKYLDDPQTTSAITYGVQVQAADVGDIYINSRTGVHSTISTITVTEIGG